MRAAVNKRGLADRHPVCPRSLSSVLCMAKLQRWADMDAATVALAGRSDMTVRTHPPTAQRPTANGHD